MKRTRRGGRQKFERAEDISRKRRYAKGRSSSKARRAKGDKDRAEDENVLSSSSDLPAKRIFVKNGKKFALSRLYDLTGGGR
ncbi:MAG: hypothetical protein ACLTE4_05740 [Christensenellaceae bacterium]